MSHAQCRVLLAGSHAAGKACVHRAGPAYLAAGAAAGGRCRAVIPSAGATGSFPTTVQVEAPEGLDSGSSSLGALSSPAAEPAAKPAALPPIPEAAGASSSPARLQLAPAPEAEAVDVAAVQQLDLGPAWPPAAELPIPAAEPDGQGVLAPALLAEEAVAAPMPEQLPAPSAEAVAAGSLGSPPVAAAPADGQDATAAGGGGGSAGGGGGSPAVIGAAAGAAGGAVLVLLGELGECARAARRASLSTFGTDKAPGCLPLQ